MKKAILTWIGRVVALLAAMLGHVGLVAAQNGESSSSPAGLAMLVLFLGIAGMIGVLVIRWSQSTQEDDE